MQILQSQNRLFKNGNSMLVSNSSGAGPILDWDPEFYTGLADGAAMDRVTDVSGYGNHGNPASAAVRPAYRTNRINGLPSIEFDGTDDLLSLVVSLSPRTIILLVRWNVTNTNANVFYNSTAYYDTNGTAMYRDSGGTFFGTVAQNNQLFVNGGRVQPIINALKSPVWSLHCLDITVANNIPIESIGRRIGGSFFNGEIGRLLMYNYRFTQLQRQSKLTPLLTKYGL